MNNLNYIDYLELGLIVVLLVLVVTLGRKLLVNLEQSSKDKEELITTKANFENSQKSLNECIAKIDELNETLAIKQDALTKSTTENYSLTNEVNRLSDEVTNLNAQKEVASNEIVSLKQNNTSLHSQLESQKEMQEHQLASFQKAQDEKQKLFDTSYKELQEQLKLMGNSLVKSGTEDLSKASKEQFAQVVNPLKEELEKFKTQIAQTQETNAERQGALAKEIKMIAQTNTTLSKQAEDLTKALRAGGKSQGMWGELQLERVLEASGLKEGSEYEREVAGDRNLHENGRPDAVIRLPENHNIIVDAKCSLTAFTNYINADSEEEKNTAMKAHVDSIKSHLNELIKKDYSSYQSLNSPSFVFMFVPIDSALIEAINFDSTLYDFAVKNRIYLVSPSSILPALRVVSNLWMQAEQSDKMRALTVLAQKIFDKFEGVTDAVDNAISAENKLNDALGKLQNRLSTGKGNLKNLISNFDTKARKELKIKDGAVIEGSNDAVKLEILTDDDESSEDTKE